MKKLFDDLEKSIVLLEKENEAIKTESQQIAKKLTNKIAVIYSLGSTEGVAVRFRQQINENSKMLCWHHVFPEMNHNELVGWDGGTNAIAALFLRRHVALNIWPAVVISLIGSFLLSGTSNLEAQFGDLLIVGGAFFWAAHILLIQKIMTQINAPFQLSALQSIVTAVIAGIIMLPLESPSPGDFVLMLPQLAFAGIVAVGLGFTIQLVAQRHTTAPAAALILSLESVFAAFFGWWLLGEELVIMAIIGCVLIFIAVILAEVVSERQIKTIVKIFHKP